MISVADKRARFRALHQDGCFVLPNPWDAGSARLLETLGFHALASTSSGHAWTRGHADYAVTRDDVLAHLTDICAATDLPVNADFENGFATDPQELAANVTLCIGTGVAGLSVEDHHPGGTQLLDKPLSVERIRAARAAIDASGQDVLLVARTEGLLHNGAVTEAIDKLVAFAEAGADCLYAPGVRKKEDIIAMVRAIAPKPVNVLVWGPDYSLEALADMGVRRISVGSALARTAWGAMLAAAEKMRGGNFAGLAGGAAGKRLNDAFAGFSVP